MAEHNKAEHNKTERNLNLVKELQAGRVPPELRKWFLQQLTEEEVAAALLDLRELRNTGGRELPEFIGELEDVVKRSEPTER